MGCPRRGVQLTSIPNGIRNVRAAASRCQLPSAIALLTWKNGVKVLYVESAIDLKLWSTRRVSRHNNRVGLCKSTLLEFGQDVVVFINMKNPLLSDAGDMGDM